MTDNTLRPAAVVIGGGYAGALAANRLRAHANLDIALINARPNFVQRLRLHQLAAGTGDEVATTDYAALLAPGVRLVVDEATHIDTAARRVLLAGDDPLVYDHLIYAVGSTGTIPAAVPGAAEFAYPMAEFEQAHRIRGLLAGLPATAQITVVGAGLTGIEMAAELADRGRAVTLVCGGRLAPSFAEPARRATARWLTGHGVVVLEDDVVTEVRPDAVVFADGAVRPSALTIWAGGFGTPDLATRSGLRTDGLGRLLTDETLTSVDDDRIVGAGDAVASSAQPLRMSCYTASPTAAAAADTVLARLNGARPAPFSLGYTGSCVGLGRRSATLQFARRDDTPRNLHLHGRLLGMFKEAVTRGTLWGIRREARKPGAATFWPTGDTRQVAEVPG